VRCLSERTSGGEPTIRKQLVLGTLADAMTTIEVARQTLRAAKDVPAAIAAVHDQLTEWDWEIAKLFGGSGYVAGTPTRGAYVARLAANCWIPREGVS
jgi:alkylation response protein AidB-like acyl-CoA dehydrogenase